MDIYILVDKKILKIYTSELCGLKKVKVSRAISVVEDKIRTFGLIKNDGNRRTMVECRYLKKRTFICQIVDSLTSFQGMMHRRAPSRRMIHQIEFLRNATGYIQPRWSKNTTFGYIAITKPRPNFKSYVSVAPRRQSTEYRRTSFAKYFAEELRWKR